jgi:hypothetical protein
MGLRGRLRRGRKDSESDEASEPEQDSLEPPDPLEAAMRGPAGPGALPPGALADADLTIEPSLLGDQPPVAPPQEAVAETDQEVNERLARLGRQRDRGADDVG